MTVGMTPGVGGRKINRPRLRFGLPGNSVDLRFQLGGFLLRFLDRQTGFHSGAFMADVAQPGVVKQSCFLVDQLQQLGIRVFTEVELDGRQDRFGEDHVAFVVHVDSVGRHGEVWLLFPFRLHEIRHRRVKVDDKRCLFIKSYAAADTPLLDPGGGR